MKTWTVKTIVGSDHKDSFKVPEDIPAGPLEMVIVTQEANTLEALGWTKQQALETRTKLKAFEEDWNAPGMEVYDSL